MGPVLSKLLLDDINKKQEPVSQLQSKQAAANWAEFIQMHANQKVKRKNDPNAPAKHLLTYGNNPKTRVMVLSMNKQNDEKLVDIIKKDAQKKADKVMYFVVPLQDFTKNGKFTKDEFLKSVKGEYQPTLYVVNLKTKTFEIREAWKVLDDNDLIDEELTESKDGNFFYEAANIVVPEQEPVIRTFSVVSTDRGIKEDLTHLLRENNTSIPNHKNTRVLIISGSHGGRREDSKGNIDPIGGESGLSYQDCLNNEFYRQDCGTVGIKANPSHFDEDSDGDFPHAKLDSSQRDVLREMCQDSVKLDSYPFVAAGGAGTGKKLSLFSKFLSILDSRRKKENIPHSDEDDDGPILKRDCEEEEEGCNKLDDKPEEWIYNTNKMAFSWNITGDPHAKLDSSQRDVLREMCHVTLRPQDKSTRVLIVCGGHGSSSSPLKSMGPSSPWVKFIEDSFYSPYIDPIVGESGLSDETINNVELKPFVVAGGAGTGKTSISKFFSFLDSRRKKENIPHSDEDNDGPILNRDCEEEEEGCNKLDDKPEEWIYNTNKMAFSWNITGDPHAKLNSSQRDVLRLSKFFSFLDSRRKKENIPHSDEDDDGPILNRDCEEEEEGCNKLDDKPEEWIYNTNKELWSIIMDLKQMDITDTERMTLLHCAARKFSCELQVRSCTEIELSQRMKNWFIILEKDIMGVGRNWGEVWECQDTIGATKNSVLKTTEQAKTSVRQLSSVELTRKCAIKQNFYSFTQKIRACLVLLIVFSTVLVAADDGSKNFQLTEFQLLKATPAKESVPLPPFPWVLPVVRYVCQLHLLIEIGGNPGKNPGKTIFIAEHPNFGSGPLKFTMTSDGRRIWREQKFCLADCANVAKTPLLLSATTNLTEETNIRIVPELRNETCKMITIPSSHPIQNNILVIVTVISVIFLATVIILSQFIRHANLFVCLFKWLRVSFNQSREHQGLGYLPASDGGAQKPDCAIVALKLLENENV